MKSVRKQIGGVGNLLFKQAHLYALARRKWIPDVYVQQGLNWLPFAEELKTIFGEGIETIDYVSLHFRRGDYLSANNFHFDLTNSDYYDRALSLFPDDTFLVFCKDNQGKDQDLLDRAWVQTYLSTRLPPERWHFADFNNSEEQDLNLMASCKHNIMANSTFSWWAAFLNPNPNKIVVCPQKWFTDGVERIQLLEEWKKL